MNITPEMIKAVSKTWSSIGQDCLELDPNMSNIEAIEMCLDADRIESFASKAAQVELMALCAGHGYQNVIKAIAKKVRLN